MSTLLSCTCSDGGKFALGVLVLDFNWVRLLCVGVVEELGKVPVCEDLVGVIVVLKNLEQVGHVFFFKKKIKM